MAGTHVAAWLPTPSPVKTRVAPRCRRQRQRCSCVVPCASTGGGVPPGGTVLVAGATGGVGQLTVAYLLAQGFSVSALVRDQAKARQLFASSSTDSARLRLVVADTRQPASLATCCGDIDAVICATGTTAFPSARWAGDNGPQQTDAVGVANLVSAVLAQQTRPGRLRRFVIVSSVGVKRQMTMPFLLLNLGGVLTAKAEGEATVMRSGLEWTILRPGRLTDGPYTSYDLNTLLKATSGTRRRPQLALDDTLLPQESSRLVVASAAVAALRSDAAVGKAFDVGSTEGTGPDADGDPVRWQSEWDALFAGARRA